MHNAWGKIIIKNFIHVVVSSTVVSAVCSFVVSGFTRCSATLQVKHSKQQSYIVFLFILCVPIFQNKYIDTEMSSQDITNLENAEFKEAFDYFDKVW